MQNHASKRGGDTVVAMGMGNRGAIGEEGFCWSTVGSGGELGMEGEHCAQNISAQRLLILQVAATRDSA